MVVGCLEITLRIPEAHSLKEKRSVVRRCIDRTKNKFDVAVAEVGLNDVHQTAQIGISAVANDQALEPWLDEALCTYSEKLYLETYAPQAVDWWLQVRVLYYQPRGFVDDSIYNPRKEAQAYRAYRDAVYLNGALFLSDLRQPCANAKGITM